MIKFKIKQKNNLSPLFLSQTLKKSIDGILTIMRAKTQKRPLIKDAFLIISRENDRTCLRPLLLPLGHDKNYIA